MKQMLKLLFRGFTTAVWSPFDLLAILGLVMIVNWAIGQTAPDYKGLLFGIAFSGAIITIIRIWLKQNKLERDEARVIYDREPDDVKALLPFDSWRRAIKKGTLSPISRPATSEYVHKNPYESKQPPVHPDFEKYFKGGPYGNPGS